MAKTRATILAGGALAALLTLLLLPFVDALTGLVFVAALTALTDIDIRTGLLPDVVTLPLLLLGLLLSLVGIGPTPLASALGAALGWLFLAGLALLYRRLRGFDGLGLGDAKLLGALGAWTGALSLPLILLGAALSGLIFYSCRNAWARRLDMRAELPFGPFLAFAGWCVFILTRSNLTELTAISAVMQMSQ
jgi:leader peptidase (prepilin peptidase)/N-methyltransferase